MLAILVILEFAATLVYYGHLTSVKSVVSLSSHTSRAIENTMNALYLVTDSILSSYLVFHLRRMRSGTKQTDSVVDIITIYTVSTSFVTVAIAGESLIRIILRLFQPVYVNL